MQYRKFGNLDWNVSALGFGCMRFPILNEVDANINEPEATRMVRHAIDQGVNYIDTAYPYHGGNSELVVGRILKNGYREKVKLASKLPVWLTKTYSDFDRLLNEQLQKLQTDHIDFYLLHALNQQSWTAVRDLGVLDWVDKALASGRIRHIGFSFHDNYPVFEEIINAYDHWTFCQIQYNYMDIDNQAGKRGLQLAASKGLAVVIMEPLLGGRLARLPLSVQATFEKSSPQRTPVDWALQWLWDQPEVSVVLSGMSTMTQVEENLRSASTSGAQTLSPQEHETVNLARAELEKFSPIPCTHCEYCLPCPNGVQIPKIFDIFNKGVVSENFFLYRQTYKRLPEAEKASQCVQCLECESKCPQQIKISQWLEITHQVLELDQAYDPAQRPGN